MSDYSFPRYWPSDPAKGNDALRKLPESARAAWSIVFTELEAEDDADKADICEKLEPRIRSYASHLWIENLQGDADRIERWHAGTLRLTRDLLEQLRKPPFPYSE